MEKKPLWKKPELIILSRETSEEFSGATCKAAADVAGPGGKAGKVGCKNLGCKNIVSPS